uniref:DUF834 domain-containing protein n=1 Tax=Oryza meridionalis TaxID=40149 RepID=A0A0E0ELZ5_9ORYZ
MAWLWTAEDATSGDELRRGTARGQRRTWMPTTSPAWRVAAEDATASNKPGVGRGSEGRGRQRRAPTWGVDDEGRGRRRSDVRRGRRRTRPPATTSDMGRGGWGCR